MEANLNATQARPWAVQVFANTETRHRFLLFLFVAIAVALGAIMTYYGWSYYILDQAHRPLSAKHTQLKPSGTVGLKLGMMGLFLFALVYLYPLRKRWIWLARQGKATHWLDFHMILGLVAPVVVTFHSAFKIQGFAGMAYWTMIALVVSGLVGRYFYSQIPKTMESVAETLKDSQSMSGRFLEELSWRKVFNPDEVLQLFQLPDVKLVREMSVLKALFVMVKLDLARPFKVWALRRQKESSWGKCVTLGGILPTRHRELERAISLISKQASLTKKMLFLTKTERVFYLWHVVHRPFSLSFAIFVIIHVGVVVSLGYF
jgi:hypothetical protein